MPQSENHDPWLRSGLPRGAAVFYLLIFSAATVIYGAAWSGSMQETSDTPGYYETAADLSDFRLDNLNDRPPGYPVLLLLTGAGGHPTRRLFFTGLALHLIVIWMYGAMLSRLGAGSLALSLFGLILLLPPFVQSTAMVLTENLAQFCLATTVFNFFLWWRKRRLIYLAFASTAAGYGALTRPTYQALWLVVAALIIPAAGSLGRMRRAEILRAAGAMIPVALILIGGYAGWNYHKFGYFVVTPLLGYNLSTRTVRFWDRIPGDGPEGIKPLLIEVRNEELISPGSSHTGMQAIYSARDEIIRRTGMTRPELGARLLRMNLDLIARAPLNYLQEVGRSIGGAYWFPAANRLANMKSRFAQSFWSLLHFAIIGAFLATCLMVAGTLLDRLFRLIILKQSRGAMSDDLKQQLLVYLLAGTIVFYTMIISCLIDTGDPRHRLPTDGLILMMTMLAPRIWIGLAKTKCSHDG